MSQSTRFATRANIADVLQQNDCPTPEKCEREFRAKAHTSWLDGNAWVYEVVCEEPHMIAADGRAVFEGDRAWNYYDLEWVTVESIDMRDGWSFCRQANGLLKSLNGERLAATEIRPGGTT